jgi:hypothetical protein
MITRGDANVYYVRGGQPGRPRKMRAEKSLEKSEHKNDEKKPRQENDEKNN